MITLKQTKALASRFYAAKPATAEGDLALAAWRRCVYAASECVVSSKNAADFVVACERGGIWPNR